MSLTPRRSVALLGIVAAGATAITAGPAAGSANRADAATAGLAQLNSAQVAARTSGRQESVIVVFNNQLTNLPATQANRSARATQVASMQAPLLAQLAQVGATNITKLSLLNAVAATMPAGEAQALSQTAGIKEVVPDGTIIIGDATSGTPTVAPSQVQSPTFSATASDGQQECSTSPNKPMLEPEALTSIHDATDDPNAPMEASSVATGKGVIVGNVDADSLAGNPNMIRP